MRELMRDPEFAAKMRSHYPDVEARRPFVIEHHGKRYRFRTSRPSQGNPQ